MYFMYFGLLKKYFNINLLLEAVMFCFIFLFSYFYLF